MRIRDSKPFKKKQAKFGDFSFLIVRFSVLHLFCALIFSIHIQVHLISLLFISSIHYQCRSFVLLLIHFYDDLLFLFNSSLSLFSCIYGNKRRPVRCVRVRVFMSVYLHGWKKEIRYIYKKTKEEDEEDELTFSLFFSYQLSFSNLNISLKDCQIIRTFVSAIYRDKLLNNSIIRFEGKTAAFR